MAGEDRIGAAASNVQSRSAGWAEASYALRTAKESPRTAAKIAFFIRLILRK